MAAVKGWSADAAFQHSAAVSFYTLFSLAPVTIIALNMADVFLGKETAAREFSAQITQLVGADGAKIVQTTMKAVHQSQGDWVALTARIGLLLVGATSVFVQLQASLNEVWGVKAQRHRSGIAIFFLRRLISFGMVLTVGFLLLVSLLVTTTLEATVHTAQGGLTVAPGILRAMDFVIAISVITVLFAAFFKILPDVRLPWSAVWGSAFITAVLFSAGKVLIALYIAHSTVASVYGAAGSLVALLVWVYYSCTILFFGVEITRSDLRLRGVPITPKKTAELVKTS